MRPLRLALALAALTLALGGCATTAPRPTPAEERLQARADSLLALPPGQMTAADRDWLELYQRERAAREQQRAAAASRSRASAYDVLTTLSVVSSVVGTLLGLYYLLD
jgi:hypothetical protein